MSEEQKSVEEKPDHLSAFLDGAPLDPSAHDEMRVELQLAVNTLSMIRQSMAHLAERADATSRVLGETGDTTDAWLLGYMSGRSREQQSFSAILGSLQNSMDIWATSKRETGA